MTQFSNTSTECLFDNVNQRWLKNSHDYLENHPKVLDWVIIFSSISIDSATLFLCGFFIMYARSPRIAYSLYFFYFSRTVCQKLFLFEYPKGLIFHDPGFFSLTVPYLVTCDFYFSGHSGFLFISTMELIQMKWIFLAFINFLSMLYTAWMLLATQGHYSIGMLRSARCFDGLDIWPLVIPNSFRLQK